jgi:D-serine deaminase-like pyridoxal phosphate-dependent protein
MIVMLKTQGIKHRPHIKAHKSVLLAKMQIEHGATGITCAKLSEAEAMMDGGITDILIANEIIGPIKWERLMRLSQRGNVITVIDSSIGAKGISEYSLKYGLTSKVYIDVDLGTHRCGVSIEEAIKLCKVVQQLPNIEIVGLFGYSSRAYGQPDEASMRAASENETFLLLKAKDEIENATGIKFQNLSSGSSYSSKMPETMAGVTESRAGNYVFNDATALRSGICTPDDCALRVVATVISNPEPGRLILDSGSKSLSSDGSRYDNLYGFIMEYPEMEIYALNEEHAYVRYPKHYYPRVGEKVTIIPNHSCVISNLFGELVGVYEDGSTKVIPIEGRGALQ